MLSFETLHTAVEEFPYKGERLGSGFTLEATNSRNGPTWPGEYVDNTMLYCPGKRFRYDTVDTAGQYVPELISCGGDQSEGNRQSVN